MSETTFDPQLIERYLGRLSASEEVALRLRLAGDAELRTQDTALAAVFRALETPPAVPAPTDLAARVLARVEAAPAPWRIAPAALDLAEIVDEPSPRWIRFWSLREIVATAAMVVLMIGFAVPSLLAMRERNQRMGCSANLAALGFGMQQYAQIHNASLPFIGWNPRSHSWAPSSDPSLVTLPNRRHMYPLLQQAYVMTPRLFVCPARGGVPMPAEEVRQRDDFLDSGNVSYAYFNMAGARPSAQDNPALPVLADDNPMFDDGVPLFNRLGLRSRAALNSRAHRGAGQNLLVLDGHVKWITTPESGLDGDNIWTLQNVEDYTGREGPATPVDAHLIK